MTLSKTLLFKTNTLLKTFRYHQHIYSSGFHSLHNVNLRYENNLRPVLCVSFCRHESTEIKDTILNLPTTNASIDTTPANGVLPDIPVPGAEKVINVSDLPDVIPEAVVVLNKLGEPSLQSVGLGSYFTPVGWIQHGLEFLHVTFNFPWWGAIATSVLILRLLMFPLVIKQQRHAVKMHNLMPRMLELQDELQTAKAQGNQVEVLKANYKLVAFMQESGTNPLKAAALPMLQAPIFFSYFLAIRQMSNVPVESMSTGGMLWFVDLTLPDQYYVLPLMVSCTLYLILECGVDMSKLAMNSSMTRLTSVGFKVIPIIVFPFIVNFPAGLGVYWLSTNVISFCQVMILKVPAVREYFKIQMKAREQPSALKGAANPKKILSDVKTTFSSMRLEKELNEREKMDQARFNRAGKLPPAKTFKYNPTLVESKDAVPAKKKFSLK